MPFYHQPYKFGNLFIYFHINMPISLTKTQINKLEQILPENKINPFDTNIK